MAGLKRRSQASPNCAPIDPHRRPGVTPGVAEGQDHQVGSAVDDLGDVEEVRSGLDKAPQLDHPDHPIEVAVTGGLHLRQQVDPAQTGGDLSGLEVDIDPDHALHAPCGVEGDLTRDVDQGPAPDEGDIVGDGRDRNRKGDSGGGKADFNFGHGASLSPPKAAGQA